MAFLAAVRRMGILGGRKTADRFRQTAARNPRFEREVKFAQYFIPGGRRTADILGSRKTAGSIGDDRIVSAERDAERCANPA